MPTPSPLGEFDIIERFFRHRGSERADVLLGVGDDAALLRPPSGTEIAITTDTLIGGVHFPADMPPRAVGHRSLAVNLSDLAAMGAEPAWVLLALTLPEADEAWLDAFAEGFADLAERQGAALIGGDITRGELSVTVTALGLLPMGGALRRDGARAGDRIMVTGELGCAALAVEAWKGSVKLDPEELADCRLVLEYPEPAISAGVALRGIASSAIDVSDGLIADLGHVLEASGLGARLDPTVLPIAAPLAARGLQALALRGGDDYVLCVTVPDDRVDAARAAVGAVGEDLTQIGVCEAEPGLRGLESLNLAPGPGGWDHFTR
jgi:thiamine-monophosphate kinase